MKRVTLLTDFGTRDGYAAAMAGVIAAIAPDTVAEHASHGIAPGDLHAAALALVRYATTYPEGTVHLVVVDPGVGTSRRPLAARIDGRFYVAPDNGVLTRVLRSAGRAEIVEIIPDKRAEPASATFHGRDVFAPAAARLAADIPLERLGLPVDDPVLLHVTDPKRVGARAEGQVMHVDRFGSLITDIPGAWLQPRTTTVRVGSVEVGALRRTYADVEPGEILALIGSLGMLEVAVRDGSAADRLAADRGAIVTCDGVRSD